MTTDRDWNGADTASVIGKLNVSSHRVRHSHLAAPVASGPAARRRRRSQGWRTSRWTVSMLAAAAAVGGAVAGAHPTNTPLVDPLYGAALAALITYACASASRWTWLVLSTAAVAMSRGLVVGPRRGGLRDGVRLSVSPPAPPARRARGRAGGPEPAAMAEPTSSMASRQSWP